MAMARPARNLLGGIRDGIERYSWSPVPTELKGGCERKQHRDARRMANEGLEGVRMARLSTSILRLHAVRM